MYRGGNRDDGPKGGAAHLARIHGTEEDKVNCPFYFKIGACRHGDRCSRQHHRPPFSQTIIVPHMWLNPLSAIAAAGGDVAAFDDDKVQEGLDEFYEEVFEELRKFGEIEEMHVIENLGDHMTGNFYICEICVDEEDAEKAKNSLHGRYYAGRLLSCEYSPVTDFREARCRQFDDTTCGRGGYCNFLHVREPSRELRKHLEKEHGFYIGKAKGSSSSSSTDRGDRGNGDKDYRRSDDRRSDKDDGNKRGGDDNRRSDDRRDSRDSRGDRKDDRDGRDRREDRRDDRRHDDRDSRRDYDSRISERSDNRRDEGSHNSSGSGYEESK